MREKMYQHLSKNAEHQFHLKTDKGGITDIEFIAQYLVLNYAHEHPQMAVWSDNVRIFESSIECGMLSQEQGEGLKDCYIKLRNQIHHLNLLNKESIVDGHEFSEERAFVRQMWALLFNP